jgi:hypothetical protein
MTVSVSASAATDARATETTASNPIIGTSNAAGEPCRSAHPRNRTNCHRRNRSSPDDQKRTSRRDSSAQPTRTGLGLRRPARSRVTLNRPLPTAHVGAARIATLPAGALRLPPSIRRWPAELGTLCASLLVNAASFRPLRDCLPARIQSGWQRGDFRTQTALSAGVLACCCSRRTHCRSSGFCSRGPVSTNCNEPGRQRTAISH